MKCGALYTHRTEKVFHGKKKKHFTLGLYRIIKKELQLLNYISISSTSVAYMTLFLFFEKDQFKV